MSRYLFAEVGLTALTIFGLSVIDINSASSQPSILNPSFEIPGHNLQNSFQILSSGSTNITGWTVGGAGIDYFKSSTPSDLFSTDGLYSVNYVRGPQEGGSISTTISNLIIGTQYNMFFDVIQSELVPGTALTATVNTTSQTYTNSVASVWQRHSLSFMADATTAILSFAGPTSGAVDAGYAHIDNISISAITTTVPEPSPIIGLGVLTTFAVGTGFKRKLGKANKKSKLL